MMKTVRALAGLAGLLPIAVVAQFNMYDHPGYQSIFSITTSPGAIHMVAYPSGVITSVNNGAAWNPTNTGLPAGTAIESVYYNNAALFCGTHSGVYKSTNGGGSWAPANTNMPATSGTNFVNKFFHYGGTTFAIHSTQVGGTNTGGIWRTTDDGANWYSGNTGLSANMTVYQIAVIGNVLWCATNTGLAYSNNLGVSWTLDPASNFSCYAVQGTPSRMVIISSFGYRYRNYSGSWQAWQEGTGDPSTPSTGELILYDGKYWAIGGGSPSTIYQSLNNGQTWSTYTTGITGADVIAQYEWHASGTTLYLGTLQHLYGHPGTTLGEEAVTNSELPRPYPTLFNSSFSVDLSPLPSGQELILIDMAGREACRTARLTNAIISVPRADLASGTYRVVLLDPSNGTRTMLGTVVAD